MIVAILLLLAGFAAVRGLFFTTLLFLILTIIFAFS